MQACFEDDDELDWAAAVAEIENVEAEFFKSDKQNPQNSGSDKLNQGEDCENDHKEHDGPQIDPVAAKTWVYPANVPRRDYQFSITQTALFANTLVSLPTGLGKTLIAAVVIYNFYRWFSEGKIVFTAPSRPLVVQQIEACHNIVGISQEWTTDMTGQMIPSLRADSWQRKRVFFVTPQVLEKDINSGICPIQQLVCLVVDEAHRAIGNYAYCAAVRKIMAGGVKLRILALTATPGSKQTTIQDVVNNLHISYLEYRNENDPDVSQYTHSRKLELIKVEMTPESNRLRDMLVEVLEPLVGKLCNFGVFYSRDVARLAPFEFITARDKFRQVPPPALAQVLFGEVENCFSTTITLFHIFRLLFTHGIRPAFEMLQTKLKERALMGRNEKLQKIAVFMQQSISHGAPSPKLVKMEQLLVEHFEAHNSRDTRVIIFTHFRESIKDIMEALSKLSEIVNAMEFIGQSSGKSSKGQSQKVQQAVLQKFRTGRCNTIVATSVAEEGLDIMEVDLVICFDANISPLRMIQRMGRTGRKRDGRVVVLASEGNELQGYLKKQEKGKAIGKHMHNGGTKSFNFHDSPRMVPHIFKPEPQSIELTIEQFVPRGNRKVSGSVTTATKHVTFTNKLTADEISTLENYFKQGTQWTPSLIAYPRYQLASTLTAYICHSRRTDFLVEALQNLHDVDPSQLAEEITDTFQIPDSVDLVDETTEDYDEQIWSQKCENEMMAAEFDDPTNNIIVPESNDETTEDYQEQIRSQKCENEMMAVEFDDPTNNIIVPESNDETTEDYQEQIRSQKCENEMMASEFDGPTTVPESNDEFVKDSEDEEEEAPQSPQQCSDSVDIVMETPEMAARLYCSPVPDFVPCSPLGEIEAITPLLEYTESKSPYRRIINNSNSGSKIEPVSTTQPPQRLKRLRRMREFTLSPAETTKRLQSGDRLRSRIGRRRKQRLLGHPFIDDEAEVSTDGDASSDESETETNKTQNSNDFIDDRSVEMNINSASSGSAGPSNMMAVYRRSLLTQASPSEALAPWLRFLPEGGATTPSSSSMDASTDISTSVAALDSGLKSVSITQRDSSKDNSAVACDHLKAESSSRVDMRKRKLCFQAGNLGVDSEEVTAEKMCEEDLFSGLDLDALEAEAAEKCRLRTVSVSSSQDKCLPSFDLGI